MNFKILISIFSIVFCSTISAQDFNSNSKALLIKKLKNYELTSHNKFQNRLNEINEDYLANQCAEFVDEELGFFRIWGEAFRFWQSDFKKKSRWKPRVEKYFQTTSYQNKIQDELDSYTKMINDQRVELLNKTVNKQVISANNVESISLDSEIIQKVVYSVEELALNEAISEIAEFTLIPVLLWIIGFFIGIKSDFWISILATVILVGYSIYKSISIENALENELIELVSDNTNNLKIQVKPILIKNTNEFYYEIEN